MSNISLPILAQESNLIKYLSDIKKFPMLSDEEESELAWRWYKDGDIEAAQKLVTAHLRLVAKIAMQYRGYGLPMVDIISEGNIGLMIAVKKFNPNLGNRLSTYAMWWIKANIQDFILKSWSLVKMGTSAAQKKLFFNLKKIKNKILNANGGQIPANEEDIIAQELDVSKTMVREMNERFSNYESSLNNQAYDDDSSVELIDMVEEPSCNQEELILEQDDLRHKKNKLHKALEILNPRERDILFSRQLMNIPVKLEQLSKKYGISNERVRQIEQKAFQKLQLAVQA